MAGATQPCGSWMMGEIKVERDPAEERIQELGVTSWPIRTKEASEFPWSYEAREICCLLEGDVIVTRGEPVEIKKGDLVTFPKDV